MFNQIWQKLRSAAEKELGRVPRELELRWEHHIGRTAAGFDLGPNALHKILFLIDTFDEAIFSGQISLLAHE